MSETSDDDNTTYGTWDMASDPLRIMTASPPVGHRQVELRHRFCVIDCRHPWPGEAAFKCPSCGGKVVIEAKTAPEPSRLGVWVGGWLRAWRDALDMLKVRPPAPEQGRVAVQAGIICKRGVFV